MISLLKHPRKKFIYAITGGKFLGELFVYMETKNKTHFFLSLPEMKIRDVPEEKFEFGLNEKIIDIVQKIPSDIFKVCKAQYGKNTSLNPAS